MRKLTLNVDHLRVDSFAIPQRVQEKRPVELFSAWSDESVCPTTGPTDRRPCV